MREQNEQQNKKFREIKERASVIRKRYERQQKNSDKHSFINIPQTYIQGFLIIY